MPDAPEIVKFLLEMFKQEPDGAMVEMLLGQFMQNTKVQGRHRTAWP